MPREEDLTLERWAGPGFLLKPTMLGMTSRPRQRGFARNGDVHPLGSDLGAIPLAAPHLTVGSTTTIAAQESGTWGTKAKPLAPCCRRLCCLSLERVSS
jgi:hypothetical protein